MSEYAALVAIDWADQQHAVCLLDPSIGEREQTIVKHTPAALQELGGGFRQSQTSRRFYTGDGDTDILSTNSYKWASNFAISIIGFMCAVASGFLSIASKSSRLRH